MVNSMGLGIEKPKHDLGWPSLGPLFRDSKTGAQCNEFGVNQRLQQKNIKNGVFIILYLFQLNENSVLLRFSFPIIFHFEFRLKVTINQSFPSTVTPPSKSINVCQINEKGDFRRISHFYPNLRFPDWIVLVLIPYNLLNEEQLIYGLITIES